MPLTQQAWRGGEERSSERREWCVALASLAPALRALPPLDRPDSLPDIINAVLNNAATNRAPNCWLECSAK